MSGAGAAWVGAWAHALYGTSYVGMERSEIERFVAGLAARLVEAGRGPEPDRAAAAAAGSALVAAHFTAPESLEQTLAHLTSAPGLAGPHRAALLAALAAGYAGALQERTRCELERISAAAFAARAAAERACRESEARYAAVFAGAAVGIGVAGVDGQVLEVNQALCTMFGATREQLLAVSFRQLHLPDDDPRDWARLDRLLNGEIEHLHLEKSFPHADGGHIRAKLAASLLRAPDGSPQYVVGMFEDVTVQRKLQDRLRHQAQHDPLTGLPNRAVFFERLEAALTVPGADAGVCFLDLDGFKAVNDTIGHAAGDELLCEVAHRLTAELGADGHLVARMGGDEYVVLVDRGGAPRLRAAAERALAALRRPVRLAGRDVRLSASIGVVQRGDGGPSAAELMKAADTTLAWAKADGRDRYALFDPARHRADVERFALAAGLPDALARDEFVVCYQPLVRLEDERLVGVEALVRWRRPDGSLRAPDEFVPLAEETGHIVALGRRVLHIACAQAARWRTEHGSDVFVSVNLAPRQVREPGIVDDVAVVLAETGLPAGALQLELTESDVMATSGPPLDVLRELAGRGVRIAIDDFGTGYSNLAYLRDLPVHVLKLAGPFVSGSRGGASPDEVDVAVLAHVVRLAHTLGLSVTAEHVETAEQARQLRSLGCDLGQGWYFSRATDADTVAARLRSAEVGRAG